LPQKEELEKTLALKMDRWVYLNDLAEKIPGQVFLVYKWNRLKQQERQGTSLSLSHLL
jgi:hypothetical protein